MKLKSHSGAKKRVIKKGKSKFFMQKSCKNHRLTSKSKRQKRLNARGQRVDHTDEKRLQRLLPIGY